MYTKLDTKEEIRAYTPKHVQEIKVTTFDKRNTVQDCITPAGVIQEGSII